MKLAARKCLIFLFLSVASVKAQFYYGLQQEFGKSRVQYQPFFWTYYAFDRYQVYMYEGGRELAKYVSSRTETFLKELEKRLDHQMDDKLQVLVYTNQGDFRQTNLGLSTDIVSNTGGTTRIAGTKLSVYFNGSHAELDRQLKAGIAEVLVNDLLYGGRARDVIKNSALLVLPDWFTLGLISYLSESWNTDLDNQINDGLAHERFYNFNRLTQKESEVGGHALWQYIASTYGESSIPNILYMVKVSRNIESGLLYIVGTNSEGLVYEWIDTRMRNSMNSDTSRFMPRSFPLIQRPKISKDYYQLKVSPDGKKAIYVTNQLSQYRVYLLDLESGKKKRIVKWNPKIERIDDLTYPLLAWHPSGKAFSIIREKKGVIYLNTFGVGNHDKFVKPITGIEKISDFSYSPDGKKLVFSGVKKGAGQSDIYLYQINAGGLEQITHDIWDDANPRFVNKGNQIAFSSNRLHDTIKDNESNRYEFEQHRNNDIFLYDYKTKSKHLYRVTDTRFVNESQPSDFFDGYFTYLSDDNGIKNRFAARLDSVISFVDTSEHYKYVFNSHPISNYKSGILEQDISVKGNKIAEVFLQDGRNFLYVSDIDKTLINHDYVLKNTFYRRSLMFGQSKMSNKTTGINSTPGYTTTPKYTSPPPLNQTPNNPPPSNNSNVDINNYNFGNDPVPDPTKPVISRPEPTVEPVAITSTASPTTAPTHAVAPNPAFIFPKQENYYVNFALDNVTTQLFDFSYLNLSYQVFTGSYVNPGWTTFTKIAASDLFEDYRIVGGFRLGFNFHNEFFLSIENKKKILDKQLVLHRIVMPYTYSIPGYGIANLKISTHDGQYRIRIPINEVSSIRPTLYFRNDRYVVQSQDDPTLKTKNDYFNWGGLKLEYVFDNTRNRGLNLLNGWRLKFFGEYYQGLLIYGDSVAKSRHNLIVLGGDIRHYLKVHRELIWANRLAGSTSLGTNRVCYYLGGVDNWMFTKTTSPAQQILHPETYGFQALATNMRGFAQNARNGNSFVVWNSELRWPIFRYLANHPIKSDFINNFQVIGFTDVGMCWYGLNPFSDENTINKYSFYNNNVTVVVYQKKQAIIAGYGFGFRSRLFGYFGRLDFSWGYDNYQQQQKVVYLSLTTDF